MSQSVNVSILTEDEPPAKKRRQRTTYEKREKEILLQLVSSLRVGRVTVKEALANGITTNEKRHEIWEAVTIQFKAATGKDVSSKDVSTLYSRLKSEAKTKHDDKALKAFKKSCRQTGGGMGMAMPSDLDGDDMEDHFQEGMDPPPPQYSTFNGPNSSREILPAVTGSQGYQELIHGVNNRNLDIVNLATQQYLDENAEYLTEEQIQAAETITVLSEDTITLHHLNNMQGGDVAAAPSYSGQPTLQASPGDTLQASPRDTVQAAPRNTVASPTDTVRATQTGREKSNQRRLNSSAPSVARTLQVPPVRNQPPRSAPETRKNTQKATGKDAAATIFYEETLKQRKRLGRYQLAEAKFKININSMKSQLLEAQLQSNGIPANLPYKTVDIPSSSEESFSEEEA